MIFFQLYPQLKFNEFAINDVHTCNFPGRSSIKLVKCIIWEDENYEKSRLNVSVPFGCCSTDTERF